jgi:hypothetical protein
MGMGGDFMVLVVHRANLFLIWFGLSPAQGGRGTCRVGQE